MLKKTVLVMLAVCAMFFSAGCGKQSTDSSGYCDCDCAYCLERGGEEYDWEHESAQYANYWYDIGYAAGCADKYADCEDDGYWYNAGYDDGYDDGYADRHDDCEDDDYWYDVGYDDGYTDGYDDGYKDCEYDDYEDDDYRDYDWEY